MFQPKAGEQCMLRSAQSASGVAGAQVIVPAGEVVTVDNVITEFERVEYRIRLANGLYIDGIFSYELRPIHFGQKVTVTFKPGLGPKRYMGFGEADSQYRTLVLRWVTQWSHHIPKTPDAPPMYNFESDWLEDLVYFPVDSVELIKAEPELSAPAYTHEYRQRPHFREFPEDSEE